MKILNRLWKSKLGRRSTVLLLVTLSILVLFHAEAASPGPAASGAAATNRPATNVTTSSATATPAGMTEILKLLNANVDRETIKAYIKNSFTYWNLSADAIIRLKDLGVPSDVIAAMLERNVELRDEAIRAAQANASAATYQTNMATASPPYDAGQYAPTYPYPTDYTAYPYAYPMDYYGWYGWPVWGGGVIFFDSFGHCHFDHHFHNGFHNGFKDFHGRSGAFHGNFNNGTGFNRANLQAVNGFPGTSPQVGVLNHNPANLQANNGFPGTSLPTTSFSMKSGFAGVNRAGAITRTGFGGRVMSVPQGSTGAAGHQAFSVAGRGNFAGSMRSVPRMGGVSSVAHTAGMGGGMRMGGMRGGGGFGR